MAEISSLLTLQGQLALLTLIGFFLARKGIINAALRVDDALAGQKKANEGQQRKLALQCQQT